MMKIFQKTKTRLFYSLLSAATLFLALLYIGLYLLITDLPHVPDDLRQLVYARPTEIYASDGTLVRSLGGQSYRTLDRMSPYFQQAVVATEDGDFYKHHGVDIRSNLRAFFNRIFRGRRLGGASTLSQQLAKNLFFSHRREVLRKFKDMLVAMQLESMFEKDDILEAYCNLIYFGGTAYGVEDAAQQFFAKSADSLSLSESALLAGILNSPNSFNPYSHPERAKRRQRIVLASMLREGYVDDQQYERALADSLRYVPRRSPSNDFVDHVLNLAIQKYGREAVYFGGLKIYTTMDPELQRIAEEEIASGLDALESNLQDSTGALQGAMTVVAVSTGEVKALVGSRAHVPGGFNRATNANRHVGSGIKPFLYYGALETLGFQPYSIQNDSLITYRLKTRQSYRPRNFDRRYDGKMTLKWALMKSKNTVAVQLAEQLTPEKLVEDIRRFGVTSDVAPVLSLGLGTSGISSVEMASAYAVFARNGVYFEPVFIKRVEDINGIVIDPGPLRFGQERLDPQTSYQMLDMMRGVVDGGTAAGAVRRVAGFTAPAAGKTGTSYSYTDAWFNGVTSALSASVWVGYDREKQMFRKVGGGATGGYAAAPIWGNFMQRASRRYPAREFPQPEGLRFFNVDPVQGWRTDSTETSIHIVLKNGDFPPRKPIYDLDALFPMTRDSLRTFDRRRR